MAIESPEILVACGSKSWGGLEIMALDSTIQLRKSGCKMHLFCPGGSPIHHQAKNNNINSVTYSSQSGTIRRITELKKYLLRNSIDIVHTHLSHDLWSIVPAMKMANSNASLILTKHIASGINKKDIFHKYLYNRVDEIIAISNFIFKNVLDTCPVSEEKVKIIHNGVDLNVFKRNSYDRDEIRKELKIETSKILIGLIGRITPGKGHTEFINAAQIVNSNYSQKVVFLVTGSAQEGEESTVRKLEQMAIEKEVDNIIFTGFRPDVPKILSAVDILTFPSHEESFGITLLEAMAMEVPVIASRSAGVTDIIPSDEFGMLVPPKNHEALAEDIIRLIENAELRKELGEKGRKRIVEKFDVEMKTAELIQHYKDEINRRRN